MMSNQATRPGPTSAGGVLGVAARSCSVARARARARVKARIAFRSAVLMARTMRDVPRSSPAGRAGA